MSLQEHDAATLQLHELDALVLTGTSADLSEVCSAHRHPAVADAAGSVQFAPAGREHPWAFTALSSAVQEEQWASSSQGSRVQRTSAPGLHAQVWDMAQQITEQHAGEEHSAQQAQRPQGDPGAAHAVPRSMPRTSSQTSGMSGVSTEVGPPSALACRVRRCFAPPDLPRQGHRCCLRACRSSCHELAGQAHHIVWRASRAAAMRCTGSGNTWCHLGLSQAADLPGVLCFLSPHLSALAGPPLSAAA